jgi:hypothetical protein
LRGMQRSAVVRQALATGRRAWEAAGATRLIYLWAATWVAAYPFRKWSSFAVRDNAALERDMR